MARPRWVLHAQAQIWRVLMGIGMFLHRLAPPHPPKPNFSRTVTTTISQRKGKFKIQFYLPKKFYEQTKKLGRKYPVVVNFHGGGFTLGTATDDARWVRQVIEEVDVVVASVDYRLAPECPFPTAVEDGADAVLYLAKHAKDLGIDRNKIALSGFSSGGNMALTVPLLLQQLAIQSDFNASTNTLDTIPSRPADGVKRASVSAKEDYRIKGIVSWYPSTDYTNTREQRRLTQARKDQMMPAVFTELFDESYLQPPQIDKTNPFLSPVVAPLSLLVDMPDDIVMFTCEWDMLLAEGERMRDRLRDEAKKDVRYYMVPEVPHAWDKAPNPFKEPANVKVHYHNACNELKRILQV